jgi:hypothetical protein
MRIKQNRFKDEHELIHFLSNFNARDYDLHIVFTDILYPSEPVISDLFTRTFENALVIGCTTAGEIINKHAEDKSFSITSVKFESSKVKKFTYTLQNTSDSFNAGKLLAKLLLADDLKHVFIVSEGLHVNGTRLTEGFNSVLPADVNVSGGLAGDNGKFEKTLVIDQNNQFSPHCISVIGFYGNEISSRTGSYGGWDSFGIDRIVTRSHENIVYEIDNQPALDLYKSYLGDMSAQLPGSALFFPLEMRIDEKSDVLVRTILGVNDVDKSMTFAGNIPEGSSVKLMKTNVDRVIDGAEKAAVIANKETTSSELVLMVSCVGRKLVLKQLVQDEIEAVVNQFSEGTQFCGFYSYGELLKSSFSDNCELHNQTMTVTVISE